MIANGDNAIQIQADDADGGAATAADFAVVSEDCKGKTLAPNASCTINVGFKPTRTNYTSVARLVIDSNSDDAVERVLLAGTQTPPKVLVFHGPSDATVDAGVDAIKDLGTANDFKVDASTDAADFTAPTSRSYRAVVFLNNAGDRLNAAQETALQGYIQGGGGFVGIGSAAEAEPANTFVTGLIGARPDAASPTTASDQVVVFGDRVHPSTKGLPLEWTRNDIYYRWTSRPTGTVHTRRPLPRVRAPPATAPPRAAPTGRSPGAATTRAVVPSTPAWAARPPATARRIFKQAPAGRDPVVRRPRARRLQGDDHVQLLDRARRQRRLRRPDQQRRVARRVAGQQRLGDLHRPRRLPHQRRARQDDRPGVHRRSSSTSPTATSASAAAPIHVYDPKADNGTVNSGVTQAAVLPVYGDRGGGNEVNGKIETGLLGVAAAPDFGTTGHVYLQYVPTFNPDNPVHAGMADGDKRRITKMAQARISRFTINLQTKKLDLDSEVVIFNYDLQIWSCCHQGGGMAFDSEGNLYVTVGDDNCSQSTNGYSGNYQPQRCPTGDPTQATNTHCGDNPVAFNDARRTAGNTNDYNGKMLRFNPIDNLADGAKPTVGVGTTYSLPTAARRTGRTCSTAPRAAAARPCPRSTRWACATRRA